MSLPAEVQLNADLYRIDTDSVWTIERVTKEWGKVEDLFTAEEIGWILSDALLALASSRATAARTKELVEKAYREGFSKGGELATENATILAEGPWLESNVRAALEVVDGK